MVNQDSSHITVNVPQLPKQGGAITTTQTTLGNVGPTGELQFSIPFPVSQGTVRELIPSLALSYQTNQGNGPFGVGWHLPLLSIRLYTKQGTPKYDATDRYIGPIGEVLEPVRNKDGEITVNQCSQFGDTNIPLHDVVRYRSRVSNGYERYERWQQRDNPSQVFWLVFETNGSLHCLGKSPSARLKDPKQQIHISEWLVEETLSPNGEHIRYVYQPEDDKGVDLNLSFEKGRLRGAVPYLTHVYYGNRQPCSELYSWNEVWPDNKSGWLFSLVLDYGERSLKNATPPEWLSEKDWLARSDPFSDYHYGYEVRYHRLCRQVLMYHHLSDGPVLARRHLFNYDENSTLSRLLAVQEWAYKKEADENITEFKPSLLMEYSDDGSPIDKAVWHSYKLGIDDVSSYQLVDLYGEGLPGVLYREGTDWRYRSPVRDDIPTNKDAITYTDWVSVSAVPSIQDGTQRLTDITGNGRLDWVVMQQGLNGYFTMKDDRTWQSFTPFNAVPLELLSGEGLFADITGSGLPDVAVIGPRSVRFYPNTRRGFTQGEQVSLDSKLASLPAYRSDERTLVAFSDMLGAGQASLVKIDEHTVNCWPNLGYGQFGECISLEWNWSGSELFQPNRLYLADIDGIGASDIVYAHSDKLSVYRNQSGNKFALSKDISFPEGVRFDDTCQISFADLRGKGGVSVLLSIPHISPVHYELTLTDHKPYLLNKIDNQCGAVSHIIYRHSGQEWLDEKAADPQAVCSLPLPVYLVKQLTQSENFTDNQLTQHFTYRHGFYDGVEREYRGFGYVETLDVQEPSGDNKETDVPALKTCHWYHVGQAKNEMMPFWTGDEHAYILEETQLCGWNTTPPSDSDKWWVERALTGALLREEVYGLDGSEFEAVPYSVKTLRYRVVQIQPRLHHAGSPTLMLQSLEQLDYHYERVSTDPRCQHSFTTEFDEFGFPTYQVLIHYPRRDNTPGVWDSIYPGLDNIDADPQQNILRFNESLSAYINDEQVHYSVVGLQVISRTNTIEGNKDDIPHGGFSVESLERYFHDLPENSRHFIGMNKKFIDCRGDEFIEFEKLKQNQLPQFHFPPRTVWTEDVAFNELANIKGFEGVLGEEQLGTELTKAGYIEISKFLPFKDSEPEVWAKRHSFSRYRDEEGSYLPFYLPQAFQNTKLTPESLVAYDDSYLFVQSVTDPLGNVSTVELDTQLLIPYKVTDHNNNIHQVTMSPLGIPICTSFYGTEDGKRKGFKPLPNSITAPVNTSDLIELANSGKIQEVASISAHELFVTQNEASVLPRHQVTLTADSYPDDGEQQVHVQILYFDGQGRVIQSVQKVEPGMAYQRAATGELKVDEKGMLLEHYADARWCVSGKVEYNNKGLIVRKYLPFFIDDWRYVVDSKVHSTMYADTHYYDALGRETKVVTANGYLRQSFHLPWATVTEDENDTLAEVSTLH
ncbi:SpvB/TcaC N-terminal domain-containing protein [Vibrio artabrorum]|uniref:SpvB/TcaC N-terminal domain-containing protein n=1 Tax=Vibrio artabrorum TaxID=446374 RepID=UPI00354CE681